MRILRLVPLCLLNLLLCESPVVSQELTTTGTGYLLVESRIYYGFIYAHHKQLDDLYAQFPSYEISLSRQTQGSHEWERAYNKPIVGLSFFYSGLGNNPVLKQVYALMPFIDFPLTRHERFTAAIRVALGLAYFPHPYDPVDNPANIAICTHLNAAINIMFETRYEVNRQVTMTSGLAFQHFSNGGWKEPNYGLNIPLLSIGIALRPLISDKGLHPDLALQGAASTHPDRRRIEINAGVGLGYKDRMAEFGGNFLIWHFHENTFFPVSRKSKFGFGFDLSYDPSQIPAFKSRGISVSDGYTYLTAGINAGYGLVISRLEILMNLGYYPGKLKPDGAVYEKLAVQYNVSRHFFTQVMLKAHVTAADYVALGVGYRIDLKYAKDKRIKG